MQDILITENVRYSVWGLFIVLGLLTLFGLLLKFKKKNVDNFLIRLKTFWKIVIFLAIAFSFTFKVTVVLLAFISYLALKEYFSMIPTRNADRRALFWAYLSIPIQFLFIYVGWLNMFYLLIPLYLFLLIPARMAIVGETKDFLRSCACIHWGLMVCVYALGYVAAYFIQNFKAPLPQGALGAVLYILYLTILNDFMQYVFGKTFGKHAITPKVSPHKTWEGFIGGILSTGFISIFMAPFLTPLSACEGFFVGVGLACCGFLGDIVMSSLKRDLGIKDTGTILPGHGGILDRVDSLVFTAPLFFHYISYCYN